MNARERTELNRLVCRLADGDRAAFHPVFERVLPLVQRFAARAMSGAADADDVAQEALVKVFERSAEFDREGDALRWILGIAVYECRTWRRKSMRRREVPDESLAPTASLDMTPEQEIIERDLRAAATELLGVLGPEDARTILLSLGEERGASKVTPATFRKRLQRTLNRLRAAWSAKHDEH